MQGSHHLAWRRLEPEPLTKLIIGRWTYLGSSVPLKLQSCSLQTGEHSSRNLSGVYTRLLMCALRKVSALFRLLGVKKKENHLTTPSLVPS